MRRRRFLLLAGCAITAILVTLLWPREREPEFKGCKLSDWLVQYQNQWHYDGYYDTPELREAGEAVRHIGTNALPCLLKWISYEIPAWRYQLFGTATKSRFFRSQAMVKRLLGEREFRADLARIGFEILGPDARQAVPELVALMNSSGTPHAARKATFALGHLGGDALPPLMTAFTNQALPSSFRCTPGRAIALSPSLRTNAGPLVPAVVQCLKVKDRAVATTAVLILGDWTSKPAVAIPALAESLQDTNANFRATTLWALGLFGQSARSAVPVVLDALNDPVPIVREAATNALLKISPESLPKSAQEN
jgi:HEAT repeat protein